MTDELQQSYRARFRRVLAYVDAHPAQPLSVEELGRVAGFSRFHFHRQFSALLGIGVHEYVQRVRLSLASKQLAHQPWRSVLEVALDTGYESPEAFARAFKKRLGQTPSAFQQAPDWRRWDELTRPLRELRSEHMQPNYQPSDVKIVQFEATQVAVLEHRGDPRLVFESVRRFIEWRRALGLPPRVSATFNVFTDDPRSTPPESYRVELCAATTQAVAPNAAGVVKKTIAGGRCAVLRHIGPDPLHAPIDYLYASWLPASGEKPRDYPLFAQRVSFPPQVPEHESVTDIFLPLL